MLSIYSLAAQPAVFLRHFDRKKGLAKWSVSIGDANAEKILACEPLALTFPFVLHLGERFEKSVIVAATYHDPILVASNCLAFYNSRDYSSSPVITLTSL